ncbi:MAG: nitroreductase family protein, partial [Campylobacteraceae bacterium]|nr:nitroreductase family protein [Campylobacteraceae bacterium]
MEITQEERDAVYKTIYNRRDTRSEFKSDDVDDAVIQRLLDAAHHAPSVGYMQPWDFI